MNGADYLILAVLVVSMLLGLMRGFVREAIGVLSWLGGLWLAWRYAFWVEPYLGGMIGDPPVSTWVARTLILIAVLLFGWLLAAVLGYMLRHSGLSEMVDRLLGVFVGFVRGAVVVAVFVLLGQFVELTKVGWWQKSRLLPYASELADFIQAFAETGMDVLEEGQRAGSAGGKSAFSRPLRPLVPALYTSWPTVEQSAAANCPDSERSHPTPASCVRA